jgi:hypothetical protein
MKKTPTPETDQCWEKYINFPYSNGAGDLRILAQRLERERDELAALLAAEKSTRNSIIEKGVKTERERDEAQERECAAIESWWEEHQRALREGQRVVDARKQNTKLREIAEWFADHFVIECNPLHLPHGFHDLHDKDSLCPVIQKAEELRAELDRLKEVDAKDTAADRLKRAPKLAQGIAFGRILRGRGEVVMAKIKLPVPASGLAKIAEEVSSLAKADGRTAYTSLTRQSGDCLVIYSIPNDEEGAK